MCLHPQAIPRVPEVTTQVARAAFPKGNHYMQMRDELGSIYTDVIFRGVFIGLPANYGGADDMARTNGGTQKNLMRTTGDPHLYRMDARLTAQEYNDLLRCSEAAGAPGNVSRGVRWALARATETLHAAGQIAPTYANRLNVESKISAQNRRRLYRQAAGSGHNYEEAAS